MYRILLLHITLLLATAISAQNEIVPLNNELNYPFESLLYSKKKDKELNFHTGVRPFVKKDITPFVTEGLPLTDIKQFKGAKSDFKITPLAELIGRNQLGESPRLNYAGGLFVEASLGEKLGFTGFYNYTYAPRFDFQDSSLFMRTAVNGIGLNVGNNTAHHYEAYLSYSPNEYFTITAGNGKHFWGDGYRSMMLSDNAAPYLFLRIMSSFWNVRYTNLYSVHVDNEYAGQTPKYATSHQLSWNIIKNLNLTIFESVVFSGKDTLSKRGYDVNYLNPIIFYRPVEYAQGSSDNVFLGASLKFVAAEKYVFYSQLVLDEFLLSEYRDNNNWWANKYAIQLGFKTYDIANIKNLSFQTEINFVRPFTYAHRTSLLNYAHQGQSLSHPLGSNFNEVVSRVRYAKDKWYFEAKVIYIDRGQDSSSVSFGGDMFRSYTARKGEYGHTIGQGENHIMWYAELRASYLLSKKFNLKAFASYAYRNDKSPANSQALHLIQIGIHTRLWNTYEDY